MRNRSMGVAAVFVLAAATAAHAQAVPAAYVEVKDDNLIVQDFNLRVAALEDLDVYDASGVLKILLARAQVRPWRLPSMSMTFSGSRVRMW
jgi:hypothetical protein